MENKIKNRCQLKKWIQRKIFIPEAVVIKIVENVKAGSFLENVSQNEE